jgi:hypothetical protein
MFAKRVCARESSRVAATRRGATVIQAAVARARKTDYLTLRAYAAISLAEVERLAAGASEPARSMRPFAYGGEGRPADGRRVAQLGHLTDRVSS